MLYFKVGEIDLADFPSPLEITFTDTAADFAALDSSGENPLMQNLELPTDNAPPKATYEVSAGPHGGRMWWCGDTTEGARGRIYYSPIGRPESVEGFLDATSDDDPTQMLVVWNSSLYVFTEARCYQVLGTTVPFIAREVFGVPGTTRPYTIQPTPAGIVYQAEDGVRLFNGGFSQRAAHEALGILFQGEAAENLTAFEGIVAAAGKAQYLVSDETHTLSLNVEDGTWRDLGLGCSALAYEPDTDRFIAGVGSKVLVLEDEGALTDDGEPIAFETETAGMRVDESAPGFVQRLYIEANTRGQSLTPTLVFEDSEIMLAPFITTKRQTVEWAIGRFARVVGVRLTGSLTDQVEVYGQACDVYVPEAVTMPAGSAP